MKIIKSILNDIKSHYFASKSNLFWRKTRIINIINKYNLSQSILKKKIKRFYTRSNIKRNFCNECLKNFALIIGQKERRKQTLISSQLIAKRRNISV